MKAIAIPTMLNSCQLHDNRHLMILNSWHGKEFLTTPNQACQRTALESTVKHYTTTNFTVFVQ